jgi:hypothetical protein
MAEENKKGLSSSTIGLMIGVALFFDTIQALLTPLIIGYFVPIISYPTFWLWFRRHGINFFAKKRAATVGVGVLFEIIPGLDVLPAFTFTVMRIALDSKFKESVTDSIIERVKERTTKAKDV